jgi:Suppressor of fused protein (SUFU)
MFRNIDLRSKRRAKGYRKPVAPPVTVHEDAIVKHVTRYLGPPAFVIHQRSTLVHVDVHVVPPAPSHDFWFLFTTGMSARPMPRPPESPGPQLAELSILLPPDAAPEQLGWPIRELGLAALVPQMCRTAIDRGHTLSSSVGHGPLRTFASDTRLSSLLVTRSDLLPHEVLTIPSGGALIDLFTLIPLYPEELAFKLAHGDAGPLIDALRAAGISEIIDPVRRSAIPTASDN